MKISLFLNAGNEIEIVRSAMTVFREKMRQIEHSIGLNIYHTADKLKKELPENPDRDFVFHLTLDEIGILSAALDDLSRGCTDPQQKGKIDLLRQKVDKKTEALFYAQAKKL